ncbi:MAG TPA: winged helix-turn-helix domain-containing protein [Xanthobacteraceae bacterium]
MSKANANLVYTCEKWEIDLGRRELRTRGISVPLGGRAFEIVTVLVQSANEFVTKDILMERVWPGAIVGEGTIHVHISAVRKALGPDRSLLKTATGRGYRLLGNWTPQPRGATVGSVYSPPTRTSASPPPNNFPPLITRLIGRVVAAQFVRDLVSAYRVVTLTGPGAIGKTSLAIKAVRYLLSDFEDGGWIVELASLSDPGLVPSTVASTLGLKLAGEISAESVARATGGRHLLLVLDNCEHVIDAVANLAEAFTRLCPRTTIVATSREVLRIVISVSASSSQRSGCSRIICTVSKSRRRGARCNRFINSESSRAPGGMIRSVAAAREGPTARAAAYARGPRA